MPAIINWKTIVLCFLGQAAASIKSRWRTIAIKGRNEKDEEHDTSMDHMKRISHQRMNQTAKDMSP
jgi:hypothetical protein